MRKTLCAAVAILLVALNVQAQPHCCLAMNGDRADFMADMAAAREEYARLSGLVVQE